MIMKKLMFFKLIISIKYFITNRMSKHKFFTPHYLFNISRANCIIALLELCKYLTLVLVTNAQKH